MPRKKKSVGIGEIFKILKFMQKNIDECFDRVDARFAEIDQQFKAIFDRLDRIEFQVTGQERRISTLEDHDHTVATKLGLDFRKS